MTPLNECVGCTQKMPLPPYNGEVVQIEDCPVHGLAPIDPNEYDELIEYGDPTYEDKR